MTAAQTPIVVMVIEDSATTRQLFTESLERAGYRVVQCGTGSAAFEQLKSGVAVQVVLLDLNLPDQSGLVVLRQLRSLRPDIVTLIVTGYQSQESAIEATELGVDEYLIKPVRPEDLPLMIMRAMLRRRLEAQRHQQLSAVLDDVARIREAAAAHELRMAELAREIDVLRRRMAESSRQQPPARQGAAEAAR